MVYGGGAMVLECQSLIYGRRQPRAGEARDDAENDDWTETGTALAGAGGAHAIEWSGDGTGYAG